MMPGGIAILGVEESQGCLGKRGEDGGDCGPAGGECSDSC